MLRFFFFCNALKEEHDMSQIVGLHFHCLFLAVFSLSKKRNQSFAEHWGFGSAYFVFHNLFSPRLDDAHVCSPQPHDASTNTQNKHYYVLHFTPTFFSFLQFCLFVCHVGASLDYLTSLQLCHFPSKHKSVVLLLCTRIS